MNGMLFVCKILVLAIIIMAEIQILRAISVKVTWRTISHSLPGRRISLPANR